MIYVDLISLAHYEKKSYPIKVLRYLIVISEGCFEDIYYD